MAGHSKWHQIRHKKGLNDLKRGKVLTRHSKILQVIGRDNPNPETNINLKNAIVNAKADGVPKDNIDRVLKKLTEGTQKGERYNEIIYEGYGPLSIPVIVVALTDNVNRTFPEVRTVFNKHNAAMGNSGSVQFLFDHLGYLKLSNPGKTEDEIFEILSLCDKILDFESEGDEIHIFSNFEDSGAVRKFFEGQDFEIAKTETLYRIKDPITLSEKKDQETIQDFIMALESLDDIDEVFAGFMVSDFTS